ncbi:MAG TPA: sigma-70 family RNA polymerase sigma factor [Solirubrobacteraceae bacterium]|nr:sigma-70 family RNA polymerase sigma factor [Solirubrobacteraceae bacterium]
MPSDTVSRAGGAGSPEPLHCLLPADLARLELTLRRHGDEHGFEVVLERRRRDRRACEGRRSAPWPSEHGDATGPERRRVRNVGGRRVGERRATLIPVPAPAPLPRRAATYADRIDFVERLDLGAELVEDLDTARIVTRWQAGDHAVFAELYTRYFDRVYSYLRVALNDSHEAEDATQQVFIQMMEALGRYELRGTPVRGWLFRIVRNHAISHARRSGRMRIEEPSALDRRREERDDTQKADVLEWMTDTDMVVLVERLPLAQRQVLLLRYMLDLGFGEIAEILYRSPEAVRQLHQRALDSLRGRLDALGRRPRTQPMRVPMRQVRRPTLAARRDRFTLKPTLAAR